MASNEFDWSGIDGTPTAVPVIPNAVMRTCIDCGEPYRTGKHGHNKRCPNCRETCSHNLARGRYRHNRPFRAFGSTETITYLGEHHKFWTEPPNWWEVLDWLYCLNDHSFINIGFSLKPDMARIFRSLTRERAWKLIVEKRDGPLTLYTDTLSTETPDGRRWLIRFTRNDNLLQFKPRCDCDGLPVCQEHKNDRQWMYISDVASYFDGSLTDVLNDDKSLGTSEERAIIFRGRKELAPSKRLLYYQIKGKLVVEAMGRIRTALHSIGIRPGMNEWGGIGTSGSYWMNNDSSLPRRAKSELTGGLIAAGWTSYLGPWFEDLAHGFISGDSHEYDMCGAFCGILAGMPCMEHSWSYGTGNPGPVQSGHIRLLKVRVKGNRKLRLGPVPFREDDGSIHRPYEATGWYWDFELEASRRNNLITEMEIVAWWDKGPCFYHGPPCEHIVELYKRRNDYPRGAVERYLFKTIPNTVYGHLAESGAFTMYGNPICASYVTAKCREAVLNAIASHQDGVNGLLKVMSDGFLMRREHQHPDRLPLGSALGEWKHKKRHDVFTHEPMIWWCDDDEKTSGIHQSDNFDAAREAVEEVYRSWKPGLRVNEWPTLVIQTGERVITLGEAANRYGPLPEEEPYHAWCLQCPACDGREIDRPTYAEFQRSPDNKPFGSTCSLCGRVGMLEMDHCHRFGHGYCRGRVCARCNGEIAKAEKMTSWHLAGKSISDAVEERLFNPTDKRDIEKKWLLFDDRNGAFMSWPYDKSRAQESVPYVRGIGGLDDDLAGRLGYGPEGPHNEVIRRLHK